jgi:hypothetical protein
MMLDGGGSIKSGILNPLQAASHIPSIIKISVQEKRAERLILPIPPAGGLKHIP